MHKKYLSKQSVPNLSMTEFSHWKMMYLDKQVFILKEVWLFEVMIFKDPCSGKFKGFKWFLNDEKEPEEIACLTAACYRQKKMLVPKDFVNSIKFNMHKLFQIWRYCQSFLYQLLFKVHDSAFGINLMYFCPILFSYIYWFLLSPCTWSTSLLHLKALSLVIPTTALAQPQISALWDGFKDVKAKVFSL